jgi:hypothetical protein
MTILTGVLHGAPVADPWVTLDEHGIHARVAAHPVTREAYREYQRATGQPIPPTLSRVDHPHAPVTDVTQVDAAGYCRWLGQHEGCEYRLPTTAELMELATEAAEDGISAEVWPHQHGHRPELRGGLKEMYLCEWTCETEEISMPGGKPPRVLGSIFYPPWLRPGGHSSHAEAHLVATEGFSFVTFRVACPGRR